MLKRVASSLILLFLIFMTLIIATTGTAHAYIDLASAGFLFQMLLALFFASLITLKLFWDRITRSALRLLSKIKGPWGAFK